MKTILYIFFLSMFATFIPAQQNLYLGINNITVSQPNTQQIKVNLKVTGSTYGEYLSYKTTIYQNEITLSVCYSMTSATSMTYFDNDFYIGIPNLPNSYNLKVNAYYSYGTSCNYLNLDDTAALNFLTPIIGTVLLDNADIDNNNNIKLYPNPSNGNINFKTSSQINNIIILDISGKQIYDIKNPGTKLNLSNLKNGVYFLEIISDKKKSYEKIVIQK